MNGIRFTVIEGVWGKLSERQCQSVDELFRSISDCKGSEIRELRRWAINAKPGDIFRTPSSIIVTQAIDVPDAECPRCMSEDIEWGNMSAVEGGHLEQKSHCNGCNAQWLDEFSLTARHMLVDHKP